LLLGLLGIAVVGYVFFLSSWFPWGYRAYAREVKSLEERYAGLSREVLQARQAAQRLPVLQREYETLTRHWEAAKRLLPEEREIISLLREITMAGQASGVEFVSVKPQSPQPRPYVTEHPLEITVRGGFHQLGAFLGELTGLDRLVTVSGLEIKGLKEPEDSQTIEATFIASAYTLGGLDPAQMEAQKGKGLKGTVNRIRRSLKGRVPVTTEE
jgi:type IV pilus assembly protein PilO